MKSYTKHLSSTKSFGETVDLRRRPVYRGSAIFTAMSHKNLDTRILFMGYWMIKNSIDELGLLVTLRDRVGTILHRESSQINSAAAREIVISGLLDKISYTDSEFLGSIELEIFSCRDLVFPYPAFVVNYFNSHGSAVVHTTGRIYNDIEDLKENEFNVNECGFDIFPGNDFDPFFTFVNGHSKTESTELNIELITSEGVVYDGLIDIGALESVETKIVKFKDYLPIDELLDNQIGTIKIGHQLKGFFPRFIAGNFSKNTGALSITHTYYDNSDNTAESAYWENKNEDIIHDASVFVPLFIEGDFYTHFKLYPIYSPSNHTIDILLLDAQGNTLKTLKEYKIVTEEFSDFVEIKFEDIVDEVALSRHEVKGAMLIKNWKDKSRIPTRLKYGLNVGMYNAKFDLPTNICFGSQISNVKLLDKKGTFKWLPLLNQGTSQAVIENSSFVRNYKREANIIVTFHRKNNDEVIERQYTIPANGQIRLEVDDELVRFSPTDALWLTIRADNPFVKAWYFSFNESGIIGGDHSF